MCRIRARPLRWRVDFAQQRFQQILQLTATFSLRTREKSWLFSGRKNCKKRFEFIACKAAHLTLIRVHALFPAKSESGPGFDLQVCRTGAGPCCVAFVDGLSQRGVNADCLDPAFFAAATDERSHGGPCFIECAGVGVGIPSRHAIRSRLPEGRSICRDVRDGQDRYRRWRIHRSRPTGHGEARLRKPSPGAFFPRRRRPPPVRR